MLFIIHHFSVTAGDFAAVFGKPTLPFALEYGRAHTAQSLGGGDNMMCGPIAKRPASFFSHVPSNEPEVRMWQELILQRDLSTFSGFTCSPLVEEVFPTSTKYPLGSTYHRLFSVSLNQSSIGITAGMPLVCPSIRSWPMPARSRSFWSCMNRTLTIAF